jgi:hypothetical protein
MKNNTAVTRFTILAFIVTVIWTIIEHVLGYNTTKHETGQYTRMLPAFFFYLCIILAIWNRRKQNGSLSFGEGFRTGALISVYYSILVAIWYAIYAEVINKEYQSSLLAFTRKQLEASNASQQEMTAKLKEVEMSSGGSFLSYVLLFVFMTVGGLVISLIASAILKKKKAVTV